MIICIIIQSFLWLGFRFRKNVVRKDLEATEAWDLQSKKKTSVNFGFAPYCVSGPFFQQRTMLIRDKLTF